MKEVNLKNELIWMILELMDSYKYSILNKLSIKESIEQKCKN